MRILGITGGVGVVALLAFAGTQPRVIVVDGLTETAGAMPECPHNWEFKGRLGSSSFPNERTNVPEFHDCQRLRSRRESYGPLAAVFALDSLERISDRTLAGLPGTALALIYLPPDAPGDTFPDTYGALGLTKRFACVIVRRSGTSGAAWIAPGDNLGVCDAESIRRATASASPLQLRVSVPTTLGAAPPPVARWDWDDVTRTQYVGVRCGNAWCEIGVKGFRSSADHDPGAAAGTERRGYAFRGAYDEQRLADFLTVPGTPAPRLVPAMNRGTVVPLPELDALTRTPPAPGEWVRAARVHLGPSAGSYTGKFNFAVSNVAPSDPGAATVSLCIATDTVRCRAAEPNTTLDVRRCTAESNSNRWIARVDRRGADSKYFCVLYRPHGDENFFIPPVVRWRWRADDETIWISCPSGCCEVNAKGRT